MLTKFIERMVIRIMQTQRSQDRVSQLIATPDGPPTSKVRTFVVHDALNGHYIEYMRRKYNPNGPDDYVREIYIVQPGEALIDAIAAVLVILEK